MSRYHRRHRLDDDRQADYYLVVFVVLVLIALAAVITIQQLTLAETETGQTPGP